MIFTNSFSNLVSHFPLHSGIEIVATGHNSSSKRTAINAQISNQSATQSWQVTEATGVIKTLSETVEKLKMTMMVEQHALVTSAAAVAITVVIASAQHKTTAPTATSDRFVSTSSCSFYAIDRLQETTSIWR